jgi:hypothetical protein
MIPYGPTSLVGREQELAQVESLLRERPLVTLKDTSAAGRHGWRCGPRGMPSVP